MPWQRWRFKQNKVYARVSEAGALLTEAGVVEIRYKLTDPRAYRVAPSNLGALSSADGGDTIWPDEDAVPAAPPDPDAPKAAKKPKKAASTAADPSSPPPTAPSDATHPAGKESIVIYTDGACSGNPGPAGLGVVLISGPHRKELSEYLGEGTNNIAELMAVKRGLESVKDRRRHILLHTDSAYSIGVITKGWKAKANQTLIAEIRALAGQFSDLHFIKVAGHAGVPENERCDQLAREAVERRG